MALELKEQYDKIYKYCYFKVNNAQLAEDLTQETFLKFFSQSSYISRGKPLAYLYTIAKNLCVDAYRKKETIALDDSLCDSSATKSFNTLETNISVKQAVSTLSPELQEIIFLRFINELSIMEISSITNMSRFAVHRKIKNALSKLKLILREEDFA